ncbi:hypothetical protein [Thermodesulforhabdus norvegica]|uniref:Uncharacterized protein n=1 Tax=Thermodesulforhabdus norvegica TaxID=39841 RepID=A0A1I4RM41_9BACT|nr:hypothetical protein [Thermodesulforhabdus norvegica]SFM53050.1 hypothetical protein SAMN05660836_00682 [Thermodesulforhabdus norvegica]
MTVMCCPWDPFWFGRVVALNLTSHRAAEDRGKFPHFCDLL